MENSYYSRYLKYKKKYLSLKNKKIGGAGGKIGGEKIGNFENYVKGLTDDLLVYKGKDDNFYAKIEQGDRFLRQIASPNFAGIDENNKPIIRRCIPGFTSKTKDETIIYYKYLNNLNLQIPETMSKFDAFADKFKKFIDEGKATRKQLDLINDLLLKMDNANDEQMQADKKEFNELKLCMNKLTSTPRAMDLFINAYDDDQGEVTESVPVTDKVLVEDEAVDEEPEDDK